MNSPRFHTIEKNINNVFCNPLYHTKRKKNQAHVIAPAMAIEYLMLLQYNYIIIMEVLHTQQLNQQLNRNY